MGITVWQQLGFGVYNQRSNHKKTQSLFLRQSCSNIFVHQCLWYYNSLNRSHPTVPQTAGEKVLYRYSRTLFSLNRKKKQVIFGNMLNLEDWPSKKARYKMDNCYMVPGTWDSQFTPQRGVKGWKKAGVVLSRFRSKKLWEVVMWWYDGFDCQLATLHHYLRSESQWGTVLVMLVCEHPKMGFS